MQWADCIRQLREVFKMNNKFIQQPAVFIRQANQYTPVSINPTNQWKPPIFSLKLYKRQLRVMKYLRHKDVPANALYNRAQIQQIQMVPKNSSIVLTENYK